MAGSPFHTSGFFVNPSTAFAHQPSPEESWILAEEETANYASDLSDEAVVTTREKIGTSSSLHKSEKAMEPDASLGKSPPLRASRLVKASGRSPQQISTEPELIMPSMSSSQINDSWAEAGPRSGAGGSKLRKRQPMSARQRSYRNTDRAEQQFNEVYWRNILNFGSKSMKTLYNCFEDFVVPSFQLVLSIFFTTLRILKPLLIFFAAIWIVLLLGSRYASYAVSYALAPVCSLPGATYLNLPFCTNTKSIDAPDFESLMNVQSTFEDILAVTSGACSLPYAMKRTESSVRSLKAAVQYSPLTSRNELVFEFDSFIDTARKTSEGLSFFYILIGGTVDRVLSTNRWTIRRLNQIDEDQRNSGSVYRVLDDLLRNAFVYPKSPQELVLEQYIRHTRAVKTEIANAVGDAKTLLEHLRHLEDRLNNIQSISVRDGIVLRGERDQLLTHLWTKLGGNRNLIRSADEQLGLLANVELYRKTAWDHVSATMVNLQNIAAGLDYLEAQLMNPRDHRDRDYPPLRVHIDHIEGAVERLGVERNKLRRAQDDVHDRVASWKNKKEKAAIDEI